MKKKESVIVQGTEISVLSHKQDDFISLTDMAKHKNAEIPGTVISHWMSTNFSINYMGLWEQMNNPISVVVAVIASKTASGEAHYEYQC